MIKQQLYVSKVNHLFRGFRCDFVVSGKSTEPVKPCKSSFLYPSKRFWRESFCTIWGRTNLYVDFEVALDIVYEFPPVSAVDKPFLDRRPGIGHLFTYGVREAGVMNPGTADTSSKNESVAVNRYVALDALYFLICIEAVVTLPIARLVIL